MTRKLLLFVAVLGMACGTEGDPNRERGPIGKADLVGSCQASDCGGPAADGNCFCDEQCDQIGDCCTDKRALCDGALTLATYNVGLAHGAVALAEQRMPHIVETLATSGADVLCLQEVWSDDDYEALAAALEAQYPFAFREKTEDSETNSFECNPIDVFQLDRCVKSECTANGISAFECVENQCAEDYEDLSDDCKLCLAANTTSPIKCTLVGAAEYAWDGRNGLAVFSRIPMDNTRYTAFDTALIKRGVLGATIAGNEIQCTHMTAALSAVPYPEDRAFDSWNAEHLGQVDTIAEAAPEGSCTILMGDLNSGPGAGDGVEPELPDSFARMAELGYEDLWQDPTCTFCAENPLVGHENRWIDHVMFRNCPDTDPTYERVFDHEIRVDQDGTTLSTRVSDHYGVRAVID